MAERNWHKIAGIVIKGYGIASGLSSDSPYPDGSLVMQKPFFKKLGLDLEGFYIATINIDISPYEFEIFNPEFKFDNLKWYENTPAETFSFSSCIIEYEKNRKEGYVYYPHPETKSRHFHSKSTIEITAPYIENITHGARLQIYLNKEEIRVNKR